MMDANGDRVLMTDLPTPDEVRRSFARDVIVLRLRSLPNQRTEAVYRLRRLLKAILRAYGFRCLSHLTEPDGKDGDA